MLIRLVDQCLRYVSILSTAVIFFEHFHCDVNLVVILSSVLVYHSKVSRIHTIDGDILL